MDKSSRTAILANAPPESGLPVMQVRLGALDHGIYRAQDCGASTSRLDIGHRHFSFLDVILRKSSRHVPTNIVKFSICSLLKPSLVVESLPSLEPARLLSRGFHLSNRLLAGPRTHL
jgi:hypothetical protein